jgi:hypothetical protein
MSFGHGLNCTCLPAGPEWLESSELSVEPFSSSAVGGSSGSLQSTRGLATMTWEQLQQQLGTLHKQQQQQQQQQQQMLQDREVHCGAAVVLIQVSAPVENPGNTR